MEARHQLQTGSESTVETESTHKVAAAASQRVETPEDLIRIDRDAIAVPTDLTTRLTESLRSEAATGNPRPWWRRWWEGNTPA